MALIKCPECGKEVSDQAEVCMSCGYPIQKWLAKQKAAEKAENPSGSYRPESGTEGSIENNALEGDISAGLQQAMASLFDGFQSEVVSEPLAIDDRQGYYFFTTFYDMLSMTGYVTLVDQTVVSIVVTSDVLDETVLRPRLMEVLGITEET